MMAIADSFTLEPRLNCSDIIKISLYLTKQIYRFIVPDKIRKLI